MVSREDILQEIRKVAKQNGGKTPSQKAFSENTDIGVYHWRKYWPTYGELVNDAGLTPNKIYNTKYTHNQLCELFIRVIREKGKWPTRGILDVKHYKDPDFPDSTTFYRKFGLTNGLAQALLDYVKDRQGFEDIIDISTSILKKFGDNEVTNDNIISGYVYLGKQHGRYKIGKSKDLDRRREDITLLGSEPFELIWQIKTDDMNGVEGYWHERLKSKWIRGEWFKLTASDVKAFKRWKKIV